MNHILKEFFSGSEWAHYKSWRRRSSTFAPLAVPLELCSKLALFSMRRLDSGLRRRFTHEAKYNSQGLHELCALSTLRTPAAVINHFSQRCLPAYLWDEADLEPLKVVALENLRDEVENVKAKADKIRVGIFPLVSGIEFDLSAKLDWQIHFDDVEHLFFLNRWYHGATLAKAFFYTGDKRYVECFATLLEHWVAHNPINSASAVWESYSVTERITNWIFAYHLLKGSETFQQRALLALLGALSAHANYLNGHLELKESHNHLINNGRALFEVGLMFPELNGAAAFEKAGWQILRREMGRQFLSDGMLGEQSVHYHLLLMRTYLEVTLLAQRNGQSLDSEYYERLRRMFICAGAFIRPDGSIPIVGDFSPDTDLRSMVGLMAAGATQFGFDLEHHVSEYGLWYSRPAKIKKYAATSRTGLTCLPDSGYAVVKTPNLHLSFNCDPRARVIRHGHADVLSLNLWLNGHELLVDGGNYSYGKREWSEYFRGPYSHNTVVVDELPPYILPGYQQVLLSAEYSKADAAVAACRKDGATYYLEGYHTGYERLAQPASVRRQVWIAPEEWMLIRDNVAGEGKRTVEIVYNLGKCLFDDGRVSSADGQKVAAIDVRCERPFELKRFRGEDGEQPRGWISLSYGVKEPATTLVYRIKTSGELTFETLIWWRPDSDPVWPEIHGPGSD